MTTKRSLRILHVLGTGRLHADPEQFPVSGIVRAVLEIAKRQVAVGHRVHVVCMADVPWTSTWSGITLAGLAPLRWGRLRLGGLTIDFREHLAVVLYTWRYRFDVTLGHMAPYFRWVRSKVRIAYFHTDPYFAGTGDVDTSWKPADFASAARFSTCAVAVSAFMEARLIRGYSGLDHPIHTVLNGVDLVRFHEPAVAGYRAPFREMWGVSDSACVLCFMGSIAPEKGLRELALAFMEVAPRLSNLYLVVVGSSSLWGDRKRHEQESAYEAEVKRLLGAYVDSGRVFFMGKVPYDVVPRLLGAVDVSAVLTLHGVCEEAFGLSALESMALAKPVMASRSGNLPYLVTEDAGWVVNEADASAMAALLESIVPDARLRAAKGKGGRRRAENYTWEASVVAIDSIVERYL